MVSKNIFFKMVTKQATKIEENTKAKPTLNNSTTV